MDEVWSYACPASSLAEGDVVGVRIGGHDIALYESEGEVFASSNLCTHGNARLSDGFFDGKQIECPLHQGCFDVRTGQAMCAPVTTDLKVFRVRQEDGKVYVDIE
jgi:naphthalene 1,2-dioxygenase system ferredoxin subunit